VEFTSDRSRKDGLSFYCKTHARRRLLRAKDARQGQPKARFRREVLVPDGSQWCPDCGAVKPLSEFVRNASNASGWSSYCKPCHNIRGKAAKDKVGGSRTYHLKRRYGITAADADAMLEGQGGLCAICKALPAAHVDHDHVTGAVRAMLCFNCNGGLGQFRDDPEILRAAADYVEFHIARQGSAGTRADRVVRPGAPPAEGDRRPGSRRTDVGRRSRRNPEPVVEEPQRADEES
jgi:5-methylcytosine-specific restriction endonuclease McrA